MNTTRNDIGEALLKALRRVSPAPTMDDVIQRLADAAPQSNTWGSARHEPWGDYNIGGSAWRKPVNKILYCVTPNRDIQRKFALGGYDLLVSHHPYVMQRSIPQFIMHTALDCCPGGLNDQWRDVLGIKNAQHFDDNLGWHGPVDPIPFHNLLHKVHQYLGTPIIGGSYHHGQPIRSIVLCTGLGGIVNRQALDTRADCYVLGQHVFNPKDSGFKAMIETGHTLSELRPGVDFCKKVLPEVFVDHDAERDRFTDGGPAAEVWAHSPRPPTKVKGLLTGEFYPDDKGTKVHPWDD